MSIIGIFKCNCVIRREMPVMEQRRPDLYGKIQAVNTDQQGILLYYI